MTTPSDNVSAALDLRSQVERDIQHVIKDMGWPNKTIKRQNDNRRHAIHLLRAAVAQVIADDVAQNEIPWKHTVTKYRYLMTMEDRISYNHVPCNYCGELLNNGESHLHGGNL